MKTGTKSLLFGVHQIFWHPITVWLAWIWLYCEVPGWRETVCIIIHDWGYFGCSEMDGCDGSRHPEFAARLIKTLFKWLRMPPNVQQYYYDLCLYHSRHYAKQCQVDPSKLCWADKASIIFEFGWFYLIRARLSGELREYRQTTATAGLLPLAASDREWFRWARRFLLKIGREQRGDAVPYTVVTAPVESSENRQR